uniref:Uncharacterized protein LOC114914437 n=1 Tax=Elaeis guineensis var. tenera TaxID=51953 RepID=A0A8N4F2H3_ELAGV|nr:uncharacterized protein LOC114914437 [Elaeis guineensis]
MPPRVRLTDADIRQYAARKRPTPGVEPSRPPKRPQTSSLTTIAMAAAQPDTERASGFKPVIALSAPAVPPEVPPEKGAAEGAAKGVPMALPAEEVRVEAREPEQPATVPVVPSGGTQSSSSFPSFSDLRAWATDQGKAPMASVDDTRSADHIASSDVRVLEGASALANHNLARRLCQATILPTDRELLKSRQVIEMLSSFYPTMIRLMYTMTELEVEYRRFDDIRTVWKDRAETVEVEKAMLVEQLKLSVDHEARLKEEIFRLIDDLAARRSNFSRPASRSSARPIPLIDCGVSRTVALVSSRSSANNFGSAWRI